MVWSQSAPKDTSKSRIPIHNSKVNHAEDELVLDVIEIKGYVDKPGVTIIPKRVEPEMEEMEIDRSFDREVKQGVGEIPMPDDALREVARVKSIKKAVAKDRK